MPVNPKFLAARATERRNRLLTHLGFAEPLVIPFYNRPGRAFAVPQRLLTERMRLELLTAGNAFITGREPLLGDVFQVLWRMHPEFARPLPGRAWAVQQLEKRRFRFFRVWYVYGSLRTARAHRWLTNCTRRADLFAADKLIMERLALAEQDAPSAPLDFDQRSLVAPDFSYYDDLVDFFSSHYHVAFDQVLDLPRALVHQVYRNRELAAPDGELNVFAPSDALLGLPAETTA